jgi:allophanate hydrolase
MVPGAPALESLDLGTLARGYAAGSWTVTDVVRAVRQRIDERGDDGVWISLVPLEDLEKTARTLEARKRGGEGLPLYGVPFAVKDNIDVAELPTTAACPAFSYTPTISARAVARLVAAGAIAVGKTNMDQFASGLVGVRSPYGVPRNPFNPDFIAGGSSSGSAVAVSVGEVSFSLGTDTAGSGRVPAAYNNIVGLKPSRGVVSATGVVPACRSLDCVSVFAGTCEDSARVVELMRGYDPADPFSRPEADAVRFAPEVPPRAFRFGVPASGSRDFRGDLQAEAAFEDAIASWIALGGAPTEVDMGPFYETGSMLYDGPFVAERLEAAGDLFASNPDALLSPLRAILASAAKRTASAVFSAQARLRALRLKISTLWQAIDFLLLPTAPTLPRIDAVERDPLGVNASLGLYSTFANLLDLAALAVPAGFRRDGLPVGITVVGPWGSDARLAGFGARFHRTTNTRLGATPWTLPPPPEAEPVSSGVDSVDSDDSDDAIPIAVVGAHLAGEPLNHELTSVGARLIGPSTTKPRYRLFALSGTTPPKPGLVRTSGGNGAAIDVEIWALSPAAFGSFVARITAPLCIGKLELADGRIVSGFLCESHATTGARDISSFGGWRAYRRSGS